jgi:hypothetical protein
VPLRELLEPDRQAGWLGSLAEPGSSPEAEASVGVSTGAGGASAGIDWGSGAAAGSAGSLEESEPPNRFLSHFIMRRRLQGLDASRL